MAAEPEKPFRFQRQRTLLTYRTHVDKVKMTAFINGLKKAEFCRIAHERGDSEDGYDHSHVLVKFERVFDTRDQRRFDYEGIHPHIRIVEGNVHWRNLLQYIAKEDPENADLKTAETVVQKIWKAENLSDAVARCDKLRDVVATIAAYKAKADEGEEIPPPAEWRKWQQDLINLLEGPVNQRAIVWIYDKTGGAGKSVMTRHIADRMNGICLTQAPGQRDTAQILSRYQPLNRRTIVFDFARQTQDKQFYEPMEHIKNGMMTSTKYEGCSLRWIPGHLVVMANFEPQRGMWSEDRYCVYVPEVEGLRRVS